MRILDAGNLRFLTTRGSRHEKSRGLLTSADPRALGPIAIGHFRSYICSGWQGAGQGSRVLRPYKARDRGGGQPRRARKLPASGPAPRPSSFLRSLPRLSLHPLIPLFFLLLPNSSHRLLLPICLLAPRTLLDLFLRRPHAAALLARSSLLSFVLPPLNVP